MEMQLTFGNEILNNFCSRNQPRRIHVSVHYSPFDRTFLEQERTKSNTTVTSVCERFILFVLSLTDVFRPGEFVSKRVASIDARGRPRSSKVIA